ncbi:unnamed protein product [Brassicogethes aeneus]|uniref:Cilia- and flagella-associated protein 57 n=1 Tax=Brassicogethes aeneus TaxID=1431903 RepID=A0A9P0BKC3_BRAAE|nr:unnamed protein product [Brassicogethes aeneus]
MESSMPTLTPRLFLGLKPNVNGSAQFLSDDYVVYPVGSVVAVHNINEKKQKFIRLADRGKNLTHVLVSPNKKLIAVAESATDRLPLITLWDPSTLKRKRSFQLPTDRDIVATHYVAMCFTFDTRNLICVTGEPDWQLYCFKVDNGKLLSSGRAINITGTGIVKQIACNPNDNNMCVVVGDLLFKILAYETQWKQMGWNKAESTKFTSVCWLSQDRLLAGSSEGKIWIFEHSDLKHVFMPTSDEIIDLKAMEEAAGSTTSLAMPTMEEQMDDENYEIKEITNLSKGFAFGFTSGKVYLYEKESQTKFRKRNVFTIPDFTPNRDSEEDEDQVREARNVVSCISTNPIQDRLLVVTDQQQIFTVKLWQADITQAPEIVLQEYGAFLHNGPIGGISVCSWKTIFLTSGLTDRTLRIWNYETEELELMQRYNDDISSVSLHPTGLYAVVGFTDKLRYFNIMIDDFMMTKEFPIRNCKMVQFSKMGHVFAATNVSIIQVYSSVSFNLLFTYKGHNGRIKGLSWAAEDRILGSCGTEGAVYEWDVGNSMRINEVIIKSNSFYDCAMTSNGKSTYAVGNDGRLRELVASNITRDVAISSDSLDCVVLSQLDSMIFVASGGSVFTVKTPILDKAESIEYVMHSEKITQMAISFDDRWLITGSDDGSLCFWKVSSVEGKTVKLDPDFQPSKEILISKHNLEEKINMIRELQLRLKESETEHAYQMRQSDAIHALKMKDVHTSYCGAIEDLKEKNDKMDSTHTNVLNKIHEEIAAMEICHDEYVMKLEANYNEKLIVEYDKYVQLEERLSKVRKDFQQELEDLDQAKKDSEDTITADFLEKLKDKEMQYDELTEESANKDREHELIKQQIEDDADTEIYDLRVKHETQLKEERDLNVKLKGEASQAKKKLLAAQKENDDINHNLFNVENELKKFKNSVMVLEREIADLKKEIAERDQTIEGKERRIFQLKSKNQELEKFKFILDFKIKELKSQIEPRERTIMEQAEQINEMVYELEKLQRVILHLDLIISDLKEKLSAANNECAKEVVKNQKMKEAIKKMRVDIHNASGMIQNIPLLIKTIKEMYHKYNPDVDFTVTQAEDTDVKNEFMRQREFLERTSNKLQKQAIKNTSLLSSDKVRLVGENVQLLHEANDLRKGLKLELKANNKMKSLLGLHKYMLPSQAQKKMEMATATREEIHAMYQEKLVKNEISMKALIDEKARLMKKLTADETKIVIEEKPVNVYNDT